MSQFTRLWSIFSTSTEAQNLRRPPLPYSQQEWQSTSALADAIAQRALRRKLSARERETGAAIIHYAVGATGGVMYAALATKAAGITRLSGAIFGIAIWMLADEILLPATGFLRSPKTYSLLSQANSLGEHVIYGLTAESVRRALQPARRAA